MERRSVIWIGATLLLVVTAFVLLLQEKKSLASVVYEGATKDKKQIRYQGARLNAAQKTELNRSRSESILRLPNFDSDRLLRENPLRKGHPLRFAKRLPVNINQGEHGEWKVRDGKAQWSFRIEAPGAVNLNLGFSRFFLLFFVKTPAIAQFGLARRAQLRYSFGLDANFRKNYVFTTSKYA